MSSPEPRWVADGRALDELVATLLPEPAYALDTEFHREKTYFPELALVQIAWPTGLALIDPLAVDVSPLRAVLEGSGLAVVHAAQQDLEVLTRSCGAVPSRLFDTQLAAGFLGHSTPALGNLLSAELGVRLPKGDRLTDWLRRPLTDDQRAYAAADVAHLLDLHDRLREGLVKVGRLEWALDECAELLQRSFAPLEPSQAWLKLKDHRHLRGASRGVAQEVAAWRERRAAQLDTPARFVLSDLAILGIAQRPPHTLDDLRKVRGIDERAARGTLGNEVLRAVERGRELAPEEIVEPGGEQIDKDLRPAVTLISAWVSQLARDTKVDTALLATRADLVALLAGDPDARLARGWRSELVGARIAELVSGRAALAFDGKGGLKLVPVSEGEPPATA